MLLTGRLYPAQGLPSPSFEISHGPGRGVYIVRHLMESFRAAAARGRNAGSTALAGERFVHEWHLSGKVSDVRHPSDWVLICS